MLIFICCFPSVALLLICCSVFCLCLCDRASQPAVVVVCVYSLVTELVVAPRDEPCGWPPVATPAVDLFWGFLEIVSVPSPPLRMPTSTESPSDKPCGRPPSCSPSSSSAIRMGTIAFCRTNACSVVGTRSEEHTSELQSRFGISYAAFRF